MNIQSKLATPVNPLIFNLALSLLVIMSCSDKAIKGSEEEKEGPSMTSKFMPEDFLKLDENPSFLQDAEVVSSTAPSVITRNVLQDKNGDIWLATFEGIVRYNGKEFINQSNKYSLWKERAFSILEDSRGDLWFGMIGAGVYHYDHKVFTNYTMEDGLGDNKVEAMVEDDDGSVWFGHTDGVTRYDGHEFKSFRAESGLEKDVVHSIMKDRTGRLWIGSTNAGVTIYDGTTFKIFTKEDGSTFQNVRMIMEDAQGNIWFGGNDGLNRYDGENLLQITTHFTGYLYQDSSSMMYCTINNGEGNGDIILARFDPEKLAMNKWDPEKIFSRNEMVFGITEDRSGNIWFGTLKGVYRYDGEKVHEFKE